MPDRRRTSKSNPVAPPGRSPVARAGILAAIGIPVAVLVVAAISALGSSGRVVASPTPPASASASNDAGVLVRDDSPTLGPVDAPVTLVEFLDPECEACRAFFPIVKQLMTEYDGQVRLVVRYIPGHGNSALAALALEAARAQDETKYWEMLELLFDRQSEWGEQQERQDAAFLAAATDVGLDPAPIKAALEAGDTTMIERDLADAIAVDVQGTPTFFVDGERVTDQSPEGLRAAIETALAG